MNERTNEVDVFSFLFFTDKFFIRRIHKIVEGESARVGGGDCDGGGLIVSKS